MVKMLEQERGERQGGLSLPDLITSLDLNGIKDEETREYWIGRAGRFAEWLLRFPPTFETRLLTREVIKATRDTEIESLVLLNPNRPYFEQSYIRSFIKHEIIIPNEQVGPAKKKKNKFSFEKAFAFFVFLYEMVESELMNKNCAHKNFYDQLEEKFGQNHKLFLLLNAEIKIHDKPTSAKSPKTEKIKLSSPEEARNLLKGTTREELIRLGERITRKGTPYETVGSQVTKMSPVVVGNIILVAKIIGFTRIPNLAGKLRQGADVILRSGYEYDASSDNYKTLAASVKTLIEEMSGDDGEEERVKNLLELKEKSAKALEERLRNVRNGDGSRILL